MLDSVVSHRRALHRIPELDVHLPKTIAYVENVLQHLPCYVFSPATSSVCAWFDAGKQDTVAFRADLDALPVVEETGLPWSSIHPGCMHACGHDGHTAMALALAERIAERLEALPHNVLFLFQPAEETTGGAAALCESGVLERYHVTRIFGLHLWPGLPAGEVWTRPGPLMARSSEVSLEVQGKSVHISKAGEGKDALWAGSEFLRRAYALAEREPGGPRVLRFGRMVSGTVRNAVSGHTELLGSLRSFDDETFELLQIGLRALVDTLERETGCIFSLSISNGYPPVRNSEVLYQAVCAALGPDRPKYVDTPALAAEDFSFYQQRVPGLFCFLGTGNTDALHAPTFTFDDEAVLPKGVAFLEKILFL